MEQIETQSSMSEDKGSQEETGKMRMAPLSEAVRYHRRAQAAERRAEQLESELAETRAQRERLKEQLNQTLQEQQLIKRLAAENTRDLEAAVLLARACLEREEGADINSVVERLKKEKGYLFRGEENKALHTVTATLTRMTPVKEARETAGVVERAARKAALTGKRTDVQEYMRKRRSIF